ncbi:hypothetical protein [Streptomyces sp. NPDC051000]|uniref:hypothetical protein n=1 Tax=Streptomyces sp. NPDC051000 TaxID=3155520 RepID=UPI0033CB16FF
MMLNVRVQATLRGPVEHRMTARRLFEARGWEVLTAEEEEFATVRTPDGVLPGEAVRTSVYTLGIPIRQNASRRPERWAAQEVEDLADEAHLDLRPVSAKMSRRQRREEPHWLACAPRSTRSGLWVRRRFNAERRLGFHDTGTVLYGSREEAERRAGQGCVRPPFPRRVTVHGVMRRGRAADNRRRELKTVALGWAGGLLAIPAATGPWWLALSAWVAWVVVVWWCATTVRPFVRRRRILGGSGPDPAASVAPRARAEGEVVVVHRHRRWEAWLLALVICGVLFVGTALLVRIADPVTALGIHLLLAGSLFVAAGIRQLVRTGDRRPFLVAVFVGLLPVAAPALAGLSPVLFTFYGAAFHVRAEEMDVAKAWQFLASVHVLGTSAVLMLFSLACWGYMSPLLRRRSLHLLRPLVALTGAMVLTLVWGVTVLDGASEAGDTAVWKWRSGRVPGDYYGATPTPVCVTPIGPLEELPMYGHKLDPERVYGSFGAVGSEVTLWDPASGTAFPVPSDAVQVFPAGEGKPGASIPRACSSSTG